MAPPPALFNTGSYPAFWMRAPSAGNVGVASIKWHLGDLGKLGYAKQFGWLVARSKRADISRIQKREGLDTDDLTYLDGVLEDLQISDEKPEALGLDFEAPLSPIAEEDKPLSPITEEDKPLTPIEEQDKPLSPIPEED